MRQTTSCLLVTDFFRLIHIFFSFDSKLYFCSRPMICEGAELTVSTATIQFLRVSDTLVLQFRRPGRKVINPHWSLTPQRRLATPTIHTPRLPPNRRVNRSTAMRRSCSLRHILKMFQHSLDLLLHVHGSNCSAAAQSQKYPGAYFPQSRMEICCVDNKSV